MLYIYNITYRGSTAYIRKLGIQLSVEKELAVGKDSEEETEES